MKIVAVTINKAKDKLAVATLGRTDEASLAQEVTGAVEKALGARLGEVWAIRPDAHVAAVLTLPTAAQVTEALRRARGGDISI